MRDLPFKYNYQDKEHFEQLKDNIKSEKDMNESDIRAILNKAFIDVGCLTIAERNLSSTNESPFDLVAGDPASLHLMGFEIKGDKDNFNRLKRQMQVYTVIFDQTYLVLHKKEAPEWLPEGVGVVRVFENGELLHEVSATYHGTLEIGSEWERNALLKANGLGASSKKFEELLRLIENLRRNLLFNRFFAKYSEYKDNIALKFYPLSDAQKELIIGFDAMYQFELLNKELAASEKKLNILKKLIAAGDEAYGK